MATKVYGANRATAQEINRAMTTCRLHRLAQVYEMRVVSARRWYRTKVQVAGLLFVAGLISAGGLESYDPARQVPSVAGFITAMGALIWLTVNLLKDDKGGRR